MTNLFKNNFIQLTIKIGITICLVYFLINYIDSKEIIQNIIDIDHYYFLASILIVPLSIFVQYKKWFVISKRVLNIDNSILIRNSLFQGFAAGLITPFRAGEYVARNLSLKTDTVKVAIATFVDKLFNMIVILLIGLISLIYLLIILERVRILVSSILILTIISVVLLLLIKNKLLKKVLNTELLRNNSILALLKEYKNYPISFFFSVAVLSIFHYFLTLTQYLLILYSLNSFDSVFNMFLFPSLLLFGKTIIPQFTIGELGIREASSVYFSKYFLITKAMAFNSTVLIFVINLLIPAILSLLFLFRRKS